MQKKYGTRKLAAKKKKLLKLIQKQTLKVIIN
jgi:hypothetical protein